MRILNTTVEVQSYIQSKIKSFYQNKSLIPFIGSGFTKGLKTNNKNVPDVSETITLMQTLILESESAIKLEDLIIYQKDLQRTSDYFYRFVNKTKRTNFLKDFFTNVKLPQERKDFINLKWPAIYTLNIDDAIERNSHFSKILPYHKLIRESLNERVFKLHGDAEHESTYEDDPNVIFSKQQYIKSLIDNSSILSCFQEDFYYKHMIFLGCSLENEVDLEYVINKSELSSSNSIQVDRIYVTNSVPNKLRESDLKSFGINVILIINDYADFYDALLTALYRIDINVDNEGLNDYKNIRIINDNNDLLFNKQFISGSINPKLKNRIIELPMFLTEREILNKLMSSIKKENINVVIGRRISGKTFLLLDLARRILNQDVYYFSSDTSIDDQTIQKITEFKDSILIFDTNCLTYDNLRIITDSQDKFKANGTFSLIALNNSDRLLLPVVNAINCQIFELNNKLSHDEASDLNNKLSRIGLINFVYRRTILENIYAYREAYYKDENESEITRISLGLNETDIKILVLAATFDRTYSNVYRMLGITHDDIYKSLARTGLSSSIEFEYELADIEMHQHAGFKTIVNTKSLIFRLLGKHSTMGRVNAENIATYIVDIVTSLNKERRFDSLQKNVILFDNLNQIFTREEGGAIRIIFLIYEKLEALLYEDNHYWVQRAKSILYLKRKDIRELEKALIYAKKPYYDAYDMSRLQMQASLLVAMIYGRIAKLQFYQDQTTLFESISWYYAAFQESSFNQKIVGGVIEKAKREKTTNDLYSLHSHLLTNKTNLTKELERKANYLIGLIINY